MSFGFTVYRPLRRLNAWTWRKAQAIKHMPIEMDGCRMCVFLFFGAGPIIVTACLLFVFIITLFL